MRHISNNIKKRMYIGLVPELITLDYTFSSIYYYYTMKYKEYICYTCQSKNRSITRSRSIKNLDIQDNKESDFIMYWKKKKFFPINFSLTKDIYSNDLDKQQVYGCFPEYMKKYWRKSYKATEDQ